MPAGKPFSVRQFRQIDDAVRHANQDTGLRFAVYVGPTEGDVRHYAQRAHAALAADDTAVADSAADAGLVVLVLVDPGVRRVEIVTGDSAHRRIDDRAAGLASLSMATSFAGGDLAGGIANGVRMLAQSATRPRVLHEHQAD